MKNPIKQENPTIEVVFFSNEKNRRKLQTQTVDLGTNTRWLYDNDKQGLQNSVSIGPRMIQ